MIDSKGMEILKGNKFVIALSHSIGAKAGFRVERASVPNTSRARGRANILIKRLNRISLNPLLKEARDNIIL
jgi:hypothetical protein